MESLTQAERTALNTVRKKLQSAIKDKREFMYANRARFSVNEIVAMNATIFDWHQTAAHIDALLVQDQREGII